MESKPSTEERLAALENEVAALRRALARQREPARDKKHWLDAIAGSMCDFPDFPEVVRLGREFRESQIVDDPEGTV